jgi:hypothetical protein
VTSHQAWRRARTADGPAGRSARLAGLAMHIRTSSTLALSATLACTINVNNDETGTPPVTSTTGTDTGDTTSDPPPTSGTSGAPTSSTTDAPTSSTTEITTTGELPPEWCHGFDPAAPLGLTVDNGDGMQILPDGSLVTLECGGQGLLMFPIFPHFGGFVPDNGESVSFSVTLDVEGFNNGPNGHFFETVNYSFEVDCAYDTEGYYGYTNAFIAMFPPDSIPDVTDVDGKPGVLHVTLHAPGQDITVDANVTMKASEEDFGFCGYTYGTTSDSETDSDSDTGTDTGTETSTGGSTGTTG